MPEPIEETATVVDERIVLELNSLLAFTPSTQRSFSSSLLHSRFELFHHNASALSSHPALKIDLEMWSVTMAWLITLTQATSLISRSTILVSLPSFVDIVDLIVIYYLSNKLK